MSLSLLLLSSLLLSHSFSLTVTVTVMNFNRLDIIVNYLNKEVKNKKTEQTDKTENSADTVFFENILSFEESIFSTLKVLIQHC